MTEAMVIFLMSNTYIHKMFGTYLILILLKIFTIIILKKMYYHQLIQKFISTCVKYYGLDPCHYFSAPGLSWDAMLKMTKVELEKKNDPINTCFLNKG